MLLKKQPNVLVTIVIILLALTLSPALLFAEDPPAGNSSDDLFTPGDTDINAEVVKAPDPMEVAADKPLVITAGFSAAGGAMIGWQGWDKAASGLTGLDWSGGVIVSTSIAFKARFSKYFSFQGGVSAVYPSTAEAVKNPKGDLLSISSTTTTSLYTTIGLFALVINDIFADYSIGDIVFVKVGRFTQTWGNSYFFKAADIINRGTVGMALDGVRLKLSAPIGPVNVTVLGQAFNGYFPDANSINFGNIGFAGYVDVPIGPVEIGIGGFYEKKLTPRFVLTLKTSVSPIDFFVDSSIAIDINRPNATNTAYLSVSAGVYGDVEEIMSQFYVEYLYNGERTYNRSTAQWVNLLDDSYQPGGHNLNILWRLKLMNGNIIQPLAQFAYNLSDNSAVFIPGLTVSLTENLRLQIGLPIYLDSLNNGAFSGEAGALSADVIRKHVIGLAVRLTLSGESSTQ